MTALHATAHPDRSRPLLTILLFGLLVFAVSFLGAFWIEPHSGSCMFVLQTYFTAIAAVTPIARLRRFGVGLAVFIPWALLGLGFEYYYEWVLNPVLISVWAVLLWVLVGPATGLAADLAYRFVPARVPDRWRAMAAGAALGLATYVLVVAGLSYLYLDPTQGGHLPLLRDHAVFSLPWMLANGALGGYTAHALARGA